MLNLVLNLVNLSKFSTNFSISKFVSILPKVQYSSHQNLLIFVKYACIGCNRCKIGKVLKASTLNCRAQCCYCTSVIQHALDTNQQGNKQHLWSREVELQELFFDYVKVFDNTSTDRCSAAEKLG